MWSASTVPHWDVVKTGAAPVAVVVFAAVALNTPSPDPAAAHAPAQAPVQYRQRPADGDPIRGTRAVPVLNLHYFTNWVSADRLGHNR